MHKNPQGREDTGDELQGSASRSEPYWLVMMKLAAADWSMAAADVACLLERNLVERRGQRLDYPADDRVVLGLTV
jgi:hypothetical protein